ncbi:MAG TPA: hypothetical protein VFJ16_30150 [Longimicrobium sp.]|nr:hypothetical protein [Longimicrobium sp.]
MTLTSEDLKLLREGAQARGEAIARRIREVDEQRRALWLRMDLQRERSATPSAAGPGVAPSADMAPAMAAGAEVTPAAPLAAEAPAPGAETLALVG